MPALQSIPAIFLDTFATLPSGFEGSVAFYRAPDGAWRIEVTNATPHAQTVEPLSPALRSLVLRTFATLPLTWHGAVTFVCDRMHLAPWRAQVKSYVAVPRDGGVVSVQGENGGKNSYA